MLSNRHSDPSISENAASPPPPSPPACEARGGTLFARGYACVLAKGLWGDIFNDSKHWAQRIIKLQHGHRPHGWCTITLWTHWFLEIPSERRNHRANKTVSPLVLSYVYTQSYSCSIVAMQPHSKFVVVYGEQFRMILGRQEYQFLLTLRSCISIFFQVIMFYQWNHSAKTMWISHTVMYSPFDWPYFNYWSTCIRFNYFRSSLAHGSRSCLMAFTNNNNQLKSYFIFEVFPLQHFMQLQHTVPPRVLRVWCDTRWCDVRAQNALSRVLQFYTCIITLQNGAAQGSALCVMKICRSNTALKLKNLLRTIIYD